jgi:preprotein translocase subunit SecA
MSAQLNTRRAPLPEKVETVESGLDRWCIGAGARFLNARAMSRKRGRNFVDGVLRQAQVLAPLREDELRDALLSTRREMMRESADADETAVAAFALVREMCGRVLGVRHHPCQILGGMVMLNGMLAEMATGEGKTVTAVLPAATMALRGTPVHVVTVNDYLANRDAEELRPLYAALGLSVGLIVHGLSPEQKRVEYARDVVYCSNKELAFDYLRDRIALREYRTHALWQIQSSLGAGGSCQQPIMRGLHYAIVDEADSVLIDEARTPLIISSERPDEHAAVYRDALKVVRTLRLGEHFRFDANAKSVMLTSLGRAALGGAAECKAGILAIPSAREDMARQCLMALHVFQRDHHYIVSDGKVQIVDEYTGRVMADRTWERGLHQFVELKEGCELSTRRETIARVTYQRLFRRYLKLSGMSGTSAEVADEMLSIYGLATVRVPTHRRVLRRNLGTTMLAIEQQKLARVVERALELSAKGRPVLIGTRSVAASEALSRLLLERGANHALLNARQDVAEAEAISLAGQPGRITVATNMAGRGTDIKLTAESRAAGGLHVILTEFHESGRIDRQLFGRSGRQGDPGTCEAITAVTDDLYVQFFPRWLCGRSVGAELRRSMAQGAAERRYRAERMLTFRQEQGQGDRLAFAGTHE